MSLRVEVIDEQRAARVSRAGIQAVVRQLLRRAAGAQPPAWSEIRVILLDNAGIRVVHRRIMQKPSVTDVITQALRPHPGGGLGWSADLYINVERALRAGKAHGTGAAHEFALYLAHGCDHLQGGRDDTPRRRAMMLRREEEWLRDVRIPRVTVLGRK